MIKRRSLLLAAPALILPKRFARAQLPLTGAGRAASGGGGVADTWDPNPVNSTASITGGNLVATTTNISTGQFAQSLVSHAPSSGRFYWEITFSGAAIGTNTWTGGVYQLGGTYPTNYMFSSQASGGIWNINGVVGGTSSPISNASTAAYAVDLFANLIWSKSTLNTLWNQSASGDPATGNFGVPFGSFVGVGAFVITVNMQDTVGQVATLNVGGSGYALGGPPSGFTSW